MNCYYGRAYCSEGYTPNGASFTCNSERLPDGYSPEAGFTMVRPVEEPTAGDVAAAGKDAPSQGRGQHERQHGLDWRRKQGHLARRRGQQRHGERDEGARRWHRGRVGGVSVSLFSRLVADVELSPPRSSEDPFFALTQKEDGGTTRGGRWF